MICGSCWRWARLRLGQVCGVRILASLRSYFYKKFHQSIWHLCRMSLLQFLHLSIFFCTSVAFWNVCLTVLHLTFHLHQFTCRNGLKKYVFPLFEIPLYFAQQIDVSLSADRAHFRRPPFIDPTTAPSIVVSTILHSIKNHRAKLLSNFGILLITQFSFRKYCDSFELGHCKDKCNWQSVNAIHLVSSDNFDIFSRGPQLREKRSNTLNLFC